jgi:hypothetical protein
MRCSQNSVVCTNLIVETKPSGILLTCLADVMVYNKMDRDYNQKRTHETQGDPYNLQFPRP